MADRKKTNDSLNVEEALTQSEAFIVKNQKAIIGVVVALILIVAGILIYKNMYAEPREEKAQVALFKGQEYFEVEQFDLALNGDSIGYAGLLSVIDQYGGTDAANLAKAYAGLSYQSLGEYENAIKYLDSFKGNDLMIAPSILGAIGNCYAALGDLDKATSYLVKGADKADNNSLSPILLIQAGNIYEKQGKFADAEKAYTKIKEKYFNSFQAMDIDKYIERAKLQQKK
ncbi:MAG: tetratricopeptide repeat protein [Bacteroides sp.]|nr:tetratricopeptide repeat protein [Bacteroides sp.]